MNQPQKDPKREKAYDCWLAYRRLEDSVANRYQAICSEIVVMGQSAIMDMAVEELKKRSWRYFGVAGYYMALPCQALALGMDIECLAIR